MRAWPVTSIRSQVKTRGLRWQLFQVLLLGILPVGAFAAVLLYLNWQSQENERRTIQMETTRVLAGAVDNALDSTVQRAAILARLWAARLEDHRQIYEHARTALAGSGDWENILAFGADGKIVFRTDAAFGERPPGAQLRPYAAEAIRLNQPVVSDVFTSTVRREKVVGVAVPVAANGVATHVLIVGLKAGWYDEMLRRQGLPAGAIVGIFDRNLKFIARSHDGDERRGSDAAPGLRDDMQAQREGIGRYPSLDGTSVYTTWARTQHGWAVGFATAAEPIDGALARHLWMLGGMLLAVIAAGLAFAAVKGRRITSSLEALAERTADLARGKSLGAAPASAVTEVDQALQALERASALLDEARRERDALLRTEQRARAAAEAANRAKDEFLAMLGHELRNPLAAIANAASVLGSPQRTEAHVEFVAGVIRRQAGQLKRLIDDLLDVGRVMTGKIRLRREPLDLEPLVRQVVGTAQAAGVLARHRVEVEAAPAWVQGDRTRLEQILTNLLANAASYTPVSGRIRITLAREAEEAVLRVTDEGIGISEQDLARIFELFYQGGGDGHRINGGLGIGLTLVKRLVELHGGRVDAESAGPARGAAFTVRLPSIAEKHKPAAQPRADGAGRTVLLVEDNADERESLRLALELRGHRVLKAGDAGEALQHLRTQAPAVAVIDIGLPGMDGYGLARRIRNEYNGRIALVALTGYGAEQDVRRAQEAGFEIHLTKPVDPADLAALVSGAR